jgi:hypothetical protein
VSFRQIDIDVRIARPNRRRSAVCQVDAAVRQPDVVDDAADFLGRNGFPDGGFDLIAQRGGFLDARAGPGAQMQLDLTAVNRRKEILAKAGQGPQGKRQYRRGIIAPRKIAAKRMPPPKADFKSSW